MLNLHVTTLKLLADPTRWRILKALLTASMTVNELAVATGAEQYNVSKHLRLLRESGLIDAVREGHEIHCSIAPGYRAQTDERTLDLGFCTFRFDVPPKGGGEV